MPMGTPETDPDTPEVPVSTEQPYSPSAFEHRTDSTGRVDPAYSNYKYDPMTGKPFVPEAPTRRFDPYTGKPLAPEVPSSTPLPDKANQTADVNKPKSDEPDENEFTHYVHLADGRVIKAMGSFTHFFESDAPDAVSVPVIGVYTR
jgi:hypothetical protein